MALNKLPGMKSFFDATMLTDVGLNPGDVTQLKKPFVSTQSVDTHHPLSPLPPPSSPHPPAGLLHVPHSDTASGLAAGDIANRHLGPALSISGNLGGKVIADRTGGKNQVVWVGSDSHLDEKQERKKNVFSPFKRMLMKGKRRSATEISISAPVDAASPACVSSQSLGGQHLLHLVRTNDDLTQQLIAKTNTIFNLEATVTDLRNVLDQLRIEVEDGKIRETKTFDEIRILQDTLAAQEKEADVKIKDRETEVARLAERLEVLTMENEDLRMEKQTSTKLCTNVSDKNYSREQSKEELQRTVDKLQAQLKFLSTESDSFKKSFALAKLDAAQKREELREKIVDLLDRQRDITASIRKGLPLGRIALKRVLQKTEKFLDVKGQKHMLQQKVEFLSNKSFVQDMYIDDLRRVIGDLARTLVKHHVTPGYSLLHALDRLNLPFEEVIEMAATSSYHWKMVGVTSSDESTAAELLHSTDSDESGSEYPEESATKWRERKKKRPRSKEELSSDVSESENNITPPETSRLRDTPAAYRINEPNDAAAQ